MLSVISECAPLCVYGSASGGLLGSDLGELTAVLDGDVASLGKKLAIEVFTGEEPLGEVGTGLGVGGGEANGIVVTGVAGDLFVGGLAIVESDDGTLHGGVVGVEEVHDAVSGPDGVGAHDVFSLSLSESSVADRGRVLNPFLFLPATVEGDQILRCQIAQISHRIAPERFSVLDLFESKPDAGGQIIIVNNGLLAASVEGVEDGLVRLEEHDCLAFLNPV